MNKRERGVGVRDGRRQLNMCAETIHPLREQI